MINTYNKILAQFLSPFRTKRRLNSFNPGAPLGKLNYEFDTHYCIYKFNNSNLECKVTRNLNDILTPLDKEKTYWLNVDGLKQIEIQAIATHFNIHYLLIEDILSIGQRAKMDIVDNHLFAILPMLTYNTDTGLVQNEQLSLILGKNYTLTFQPDPERDAFNQVRHQLKNPNSIFPKKGADYLFYSLIDAVIDDYFIVLEKLSERVEDLENEILAKPNKITLLKIQILRQEVNITKRLITPVRELIRQLWQIEDGLIASNNKKYFKDVFDHISLAVEQIEVARETVVNIQDLYMNHVNTKTNEVMKTLTIVTTLLAPATVIGSVFGMNFIKIPFSSNESGFIITVSVMLSLSVIMLYLFKKKEWF